MKKIVFFIENNWCYGRIHNDLIKALYPDIYCDILDWTKGYTITDFDYFLKKYDYIITTPHGGYSLEKIYGVNPNKIAIVSHSNHDFTHILEEVKEGREFFNKFKGYAVISSIVRDYAVAHRIYRAPHVLQVGCFNNITYKNQSTELKKIGFIGRTEHWETECPAKFNKRGYLVKKICEITNTELKMLHGLHFLNSTEFYSEFDLLMFASFSEGLPTVAIEAFSSGVPVIGTETGVFTKMAQSGGGIILPFKEEEFINEGVKIVTRLKQNPREYQKMSVAALEESKNYDWSVARSGWINFINSLYE